MSMTWREAAVEALRRRGQMTIGDVTRAIEEEGLRDLTGQAPEATVATQLYSAVSSGDSRVRLIGAGVFEHTGVSTAPRAKQALGKLELLNPREIWPDEARHFTPWLLENSDYLAEVLGIDLELEQREHAVGAFSLDLLGRDQTHSCPLIVENQLEDTDHRHLGQLLTYAAGTDAKTVVWMSPRFRDEHRQALEYLNEISVGDARFFGVEIRVGVIGNSDAAPLFSLVAQPSDWRARIGTRRGTDEMSPVKAAYLDFWTAYLDRLHAEHPGVTNVRSPQAQNWMTLNYLRKGVSLNGVFVKRDGLCCEMYIDTGSAGANDSVFAALLSQRPEIEAALGEALEWEELPGRRACRIRLQRQGSSRPSDQTAELVAWLMQRHLGFKQVFTPIVRLLPQELWTADEITS